jgi:hypothetical protein
MKQRRHRKTADTGPDNTNSQTTHPISPSRLGWYPHSRRDDDRLPLGEKRLERHRVQALANAARVLR